MQGLRVNGREEQSGEGANVAALLGSRGLPLEGTVIELNGEILTRDRWEATILKGGDEVEIVRFVGGG